MKDKSEKLSNSAKKTQHRPPSYRQRAWLRKKKYFESKNKLKQDTAEANKSSDDSEKSNQISAGTSYV